MNRYLALCHALTLLEDPIRLDDFTQQVLASNPLFDTPCSRPLKFIDVLKAEQIIRERSRHLQLSPTGQLLHQHLLKWTQRDKEKIKVLRAVREQSAEEPLQAECPNCGSAYCGRYLFVVLIERLYRGLKHWNDWREGELEMIASVLQQRYRGELFILNQSLHFQALSPPRQQALGLLFETHADIASELQQDFMRQFVCQLLIRHLPELPPRAQLVSRLLFDHALLEPELQQQLQVLDSAPLFALLKEPQERPQGNIIRVSRAGRFTPPEPSSEPFREQATEQGLLYLQENQNHYLLLLQQLEGAWRIKSTLPCLPPS